MNEKNSIQNQKIGEIEEWCEKFDVPMFVLDHLVKMLVFMNFDFRRDLRKVAISEISHPLGIVRSLGGIITWDEKRLAPITTPDEKMQERFEKSFKNWKEMNT